MSPVPKKSRFEKSTESPKASESCPNSGFIRFEVDKVSTLDEVGRESEEVVVGGVPWRAKVYKKSEKGTDCLAIYMFCCDNNVKLWSIDVNGELTLLNDNSSKDRIKVITGTYNRANSVCGSSILDWKELTDEEKGFIKYDKITIEIRASISNMKRLGMPPSPKKARHGKSGESTKLSDNDPNSGVIRFDVDKVSTLDLNGRDSPKIEVGGVPWKGQVCKEHDDGAAHLAVYLHSIDDESTQWSIDVQAAVILFNSDSNESITEQGDIDTYNSEENSFGTLMLKWEELMDEDKGFIVDDKITIEIRFTIVKMEGIWIQPSFNCAPATGIVLMMEGKPTLMDKQSIFPNNMDTSGNDVKDNSNCGFIRFEVENVSNLDLQGRFSPEVEVGGLPWRAKMCKLKDDGKDYLVIILDGICNQSKLWSIDGAVEVALVNSDRSKNIVESDDAYTFNHETTRYGSFIIAWDDAMNEEKGFINDDKIITEIRFSITSMMGIWIKPRFNSSRSGNNCSDIVLLDGSPIVAKKQSLLPSEKTRSGKDEVSGFISFEIKVSDILHYSNNSPVIDVQETPWSLSVKKARRSSYLEVYLRHWRKSESNIWSFDVSASLRLLNHMPDGNPETLSFIKKFDHETSNRGFQKFILWEDLINEEKGYVKEGKITVEAQFTLSNIVGIRRIIPIDFTDPNDPRHDLTLLIEGKKVYVGKQILAFHSPVFNAMFYGNHIEKNKKEIELKEIDRKVFIEMLNLIYPSYQKINDNNAESLLKMADYFQINTVIDQVVQFLIDSSKLNMLAKFKLSDQYRLVKLQEHCLDSFKTVNEITDLHANEGYRMLSAFARSALMDKAMKLRSTE